MMGADSPFGNLMAEAVKLKGAQQAQLRPVWDSWPQYFQHSMFLQEAIVTARSKSFDEKIKMAGELKSKGNDCFTKKEYEEAVAQYEQALGIFKYCENTDPEWKKKGIRDDDIHVVEYKADDIIAQNQLEALKVSLYLNISVCKLKLKEYAVAIVACGDALAIDPSNAKAYYRRAQALITPLSSGAVEFEKALVDLEKACHHDPENVECRKLYRRLREEQAKQRKLDKATFSGMFNRGNVVDEEELVKSIDSPTSAAKADQKRLAKEVEDAEAIVHMYEQSGKHKEANELREKIEQAKAATKKRQSTKVDFYHPTEEMIQDGKKNGIDLTDVRVQKMLTDLQDEHLANGTEPIRSTINSREDSIPSTPYEEALIEADEMMKTMSKHEISQLLTVDGIDYHSISTKEQLDETIRHVLATKLCDLSHEKNKKKSNNSMRLVYSVVGIWIFFRIYSSGGLTMLCNGIISLISDTFFNKSKNEFYNFNDF